MKLVIFGLTLSSPWGNGHATLWRGLLRALHRRGHQVVFFDSTEDAVAALSLPKAELAQIAARARKRALAEHTSDNRARDLENALESALTTKLGVPQEA